MFGLYRTLLALLVVAHHLYVVPIVGRYAVHGFFVLSGFLMTVVMHEKYGYTSQGRFRFAKARALRLYPSWIIVAIFAVIVITATGSTASLFRSPMFLPSGPLEWLQNVTLVFFDWFPNRVTPRLSPATWALTIELFYYALICIGASSSRAVTWAWFIVGLLYHFWAKGEDYTYFNVLSGSLPFSMGALICHYRVRLSFAVPYPWIWAMAGAGIIVPLAFFHAFYLNMVTAAIFVAVLMNVPQNKIDSRIGDLSYHIYILHWPMGLAIYFTLGFDAPGRMIAPFVLTVLACLAFSVLLTRWVDKPVARWFGSKPQPAP